MRILVGLCTLSAAACSEIEVKSTVLDEDGSPINEVNIEMGFLAYQADKDVYKLALTNKNGVATMSGIDPATIQATYSKDNYYNSRVKNLDHTKDHELEVILRKKINPIPLYVRNVEVVIPVLDKSCGYDLEIGDWASPYGRGKENDLIFTAQKIFHDDLNYKTVVTLTFSQEKSGIFQVINDAEARDYNVVSEFKNLRNAPENGYLHKQTFTAVKSSKLGYTRSSLKGDFVFKTRTVIDQDSNVVRANYGKLNNSVSVNKASGVRERMPVLKFTYYFNPTPNDRNLEFDPAQNLFKKLAREERVLKP